MGERLEVGIGGRRTSYPDGRVQMEGHQMRTGSVTDVGAAAATKGLLTRRLIISRCAKRVCLEATWESNLSHLAVRTPS